MAVLLISTLCHKTEELDSINEMKKKPESNVDSSNNRGPDQKWKWPNIPFDDVACIPGWSNCLEFCCVTPRTVSGFINAIDSDNEQVFLSDSRTLIELSQGLEYYQNLLRDVRDEKKFVMYYYSQNRDRVMILYGEKEISTSNFEAAQALDL